jgi:hypothetical protein
MIDLRSMSGWPSIQNSRRARAQGGALLGELDRETHAFGLATTGGMVHHTGVGGSRWAGGSRVLGGSRRIPDVPDPPIPATGDLPR